MDDAREYRKEDHREAPGCTAEGADLDAAPVRVVGHVPTVTHPDLRKQVRNSSFVPSARIRRGS